MDYIISHTPIKKFSLRVFFIARKHAALPLVPRPYGRYPNKFRIG